MNKATTLLNTHTAYIYSRVSKEAQVNGDGLRRQIDNAFRFIDSKNRELMEKGLPTYVVADELITDRGLSAYKGYNTAANGGLGAFLEAAKRGEVKRGSLLVVEAVDRISRMPADESRKTFGLFKEYGIDVAIVKFGVIIKHSESTTLENDLLITAAIHLAHMESQQKSNRINDRFEEKRKQEKLGGAKRTTICPLWMKISEDKKSFELIPDRARVMRRIIDMKLNGMGCQRIASTLNEEGVPYFNGKTWSTRIVLKYCKMIQLYGAFQRVRHVRTEHCTQKQPWGDVEQNYYPALIDEQTFLRLKNSFKKSGGRQTGAFSNLFSGLLCCPKCGSSMSYYKPNRGSLKVRCRKQLDKQGCDQRALNYEEIEERLIRALAGLDYAKINDSSFIDVSAELSLLEATIAELNENVNVVAAQLMKNTDPRMCETLTDKLSQLYNEIDSNKVRFDELSILHSNYDISVIDNLELSENKDRERYNHFIKQFVKYIICTDKKQGGSLRVVFKADAIGELPFSFDGDDRNDKAVSDVFTANKAVSPSNTIRTINMDKSSTVYLPILKEITDVKQPNDLNDTRDRLRYMHAIRVAVRFNPSKWAEIAKKAQLKY
ncbi:recombinase family protein [Aliivibrio sp. S4TY2]|uniref:Recombinase family protein n=1 Tax=Aliivibrio finisterrensis TaxID=511998 RepID=A0A4Q5L1Y7_9GAMM|nr:MULTISPECIES: recombinase family protein [Aliivibrio]MDD9156280.1 recombinase family protein [Aliivibrio sp. S4TY2]MDD9160627.1 recombinase family protein [Aliivibrio sp. S4TY1]MDD9163987.1 recombinase family protein [Aliivibrio sp. S4MY2]MDD9168038.1 recombinase family protein [Aliivibrio sp. S4MY4]MDD9177181.1 recombinase family protein [Aliivibrio sp. A6]